MDFVDSDDIVVELDGHLIDKISKLAVDDSGGDGDSVEKHLYVFTSTWYEWRDRVIYCHFPPGVWLDHCNKRSVVEMLVRVGNPVEGGDEENDDENDEKDRNAYVCLSFDDNKTIKYFKIREQNVAELEDLIGEALAFVNDSIEDKITCEIYIAPISTAQDRKDAWWSSKWVKFIRNKKKNTNKDLLCNKNVKIKASNSYLHYRENIDDLIIQAVEKCLELVRENKKNQSDGLVISELCAGDGSLASKLLQEFQQCIGHYILYERNKKLSNESTKKLSNFKKTIVECINIDVCSQACENAIENAITTDIWIAAGSVLCGQVGTMPNTSSMLNTMSNSIGATGFLVITGYTQSFLSPKMIDEAGLEVVHGSVPTVETAGILESGFKRFHMFILKKKASLKSIIKTDKDENNGDKKVHHEKQEEVEEEYDKRLKQKYLLHKKVTYKTHPVVFEDQDNTSHASLHDKLNDLAISTQQSVNVVKAQEETIAIVQEETIAIVQEETTIATVQEETPITTVQEEISEPTDQHTASNLYDVFQDDESMSESEGDSDDDVAIVDLPIDLTIKNILESTVKQRMALTELKETLLRQNSTFTERNYGFKHFRKWIIHLGFVVKTDGNEDHHYCYLSKR